MLVRGGGARLCNSASVAGKERVSQALHRLLRLLRLAEHDGEPHSKRRAFAADAPSLIANPRLMSYPFAP